MSSIGAATTSAKPSLVVRPANTKEVADVVKLCAQTRTPIVPQGGNTGMVGGCAPDASGNAIVLSLMRMNKIRAIDLANNAMTVEAGCILPTVQEAAHTNDRYFPLSLAAEGSCTIGGNLSTNAGGTAVLRYGNARDLVLGIEAVTPDGNIWNGLKALRKDNTGYDLKHLLMGAEGTLGIITAAVLKLFPKPQRTCTALVAVPHPAAAVALLSTIQAAMGDRLTGFELMSRVCIDHVIKHFPPRRSHFPCATIGRCYRAYRYPEGLATRNSAGRRAGARVRTYRCARRRDRDQRITVAGAVEYSRTHPRGREASGQKREARHFRADFAHRGIHRARRHRVEQQIPDAQVICFGHVGDGNLHYNLSFPGQRCVAGANPRRQWHSLCAA